MANIDQEGNIIFPESLWDAKEMLGSLAISRSTPTTTATMVTQAATQLTATTRGCTTMVSSRPSFSRPATATAVATTTTRCTSMLSTAVISPAMRAACVLASVFKSSSQLPAVRLTPCVKGKFNFTPKLANTEQTKKYESALLDMKTALDDRDIIITRLRSEIDSLTFAQTQVADAPVSSLSTSWTNMMVLLRSQSSLQMQEMRNTIAAKDSQLKYQKREIEMLSTKVATLTHDNNVAHLALQQNISTYSSSSSTGSFSITGSVFDSTVSDFEPETLKETKSPNLSSPTQIARRKEESGQITRMLDSVDKLAKHYSPQHRYHQPCVTNLSQPRSDVVPDSLFNYELAALWMFAKVPTEEEIAQYNRRLEQELRPAPIHSPPLRRPYVNWTNLNKHRRKNLPDPQLFPVSSVPADPTYYTDTARYKPADRHTIHSYCGPVPLRLTKEECGCVKCVPPFSKKYGLMTDMGIIGMPTEPVHGYCWDDDTGGWVIATGCC